MTKPSNSKRLAAKTIDLVVFVFLAIVLPNIFGPLIGFLYTLAADGIRVGEFKGQSLGKMVIGLRVINKVTQVPGGLKESFIRNAPVGVVTFFSIIPFWGWLIMIVLGIPMVLIEVYLLIRTESGHRLGDVMADTEVINCDTKLWNST